MGLIKEKINGYNSASLSHLDALIFEKKMIGPMDAMHKNSFVLESEKDLAYVV